MTLTQNRCIKCKLAVDCANAYVGNNIVQIDTENSDVTPIIVDDRTLVPVRFIAESLGMDVGYNDSTRTVTLFWKRIYSKYDFG